ncbi:MAG TPA: alkaline phosphatase [Planctomycetota bacterium]|nr:alkaline phosphatase [Planctomycetota bacterium]
MRFLALIFSLFFITAALHAAALKESVTIYPIDQAAIMVGANFDFKVEFPELLKDGDFEIKIGGKSPAETFGSAGTLIKESFGKPKREASAFVLRNCVLHAENAALPVAVFVRNEKVAEVNWRVYQAKPEGKVAKNVILMIGDGISQAHRTAARIMSKGIRQGKYNAMLAMEDMPHMALVGTSGMDSIITDSANSAGAYTTGHKSANGALCVYKDRTDDYDSRDALANETDDPACEQISFLARRLAGKSIGFITDAEIQDATPAAMYANIAKRSDYPAIVDMLIKSNADVIMGGGRASFTDAQFGAFKQNGYTVAETRTDLLNAYAAGAPKKFFGIFNPKNIDGVWDRKFLRKFNPADMDDQPDLTEMAAATLKSLDQNPNGFVLMIEGARIDKYSHNLDWERAVMDTIMFDHTVELVKDFIKNRDDTLLLVLGDHTHGVSIVGTIDDDPPHKIDVTEYDETSGEYVKKSVQKQGRDYVKIYGDAGFPDYVIENGYPKTLNVAHRLAVFFTNFPDYFETFSPKFGGEFKPTVQVSATGLPADMTYVVNRDYRGAPGAMLRTGNIPRGTPGSVHSCEDTIVTAMGPGSEAVHGFLDNTRIFEIMVNALNLRENAAK